LVDLLDFEDFKKAIEGVMKNKKNEEEELIRTIWFTFS